MTSTTDDTPLCITCGTKMRPAGSCYVCEGCGANSEMPSVVDADHWRHMMYTPTSEDWEAWKRAKLMPDVDVVGGFLMSNPLVSGVPEKAEIFRLAKLTLNDNRGDVYKNFTVASWMQLRIVKPPMYVHHVLAHPHYNVEMGDIVEHTYNVQLQVVSVPMDLIRIRVLHGSEIDDSKEIVFEGTEFPGASSSRLVRVIRITVHKEGWATYEVVAETQYPDWPPF